MTSKDVAPGPGDAQASAPVRPGRNIFRQEVLDRLSSPEQLQLLMRVTDGKGWLALAACGVLLLTAVVWGFLGNVPTKVAGSGILIPEGGLAAAVAISDGQLTSVETQAGALVEKDQIIARIAQPELLSQLESARKQLRELQEGLRTTKEMGTVDADLREQSVERERSRLNAGIADTRQRIRELRVRLANEVRLAGKGIISREVVQGTRQELRVSEASERSMAAELKRVAVEKHSALRASEGEVRSNSQRLTEGELQVRMLEERLAKSAVVRSPHRGRVVELRATVGDMIRGGMAIASLERLTEGKGELEALLYVDSRDGKMVRPGMIVEVAPTIVKRERHGAIRATVRSVEEFPSTRSGMVQALHNEELVEALRVETAGAPIAVRATLQREPANPSGYNWTSGRGPELTLSSGTRFSASIVTRSQRPLALVFPILDRGN
jgi:HlyD family secretion protein